MLQLLEELALPCCSGLDPRLRIAVEKDLLFAVVALAGSPQHLVRNGFVFGLVADEEHDEGLSIPVSAIATQTLNRPFEETRAWKVMRPCSQLYTISLCVDFPNSTLCHDAARRSADDQIEPNRRSPPVVSFKTAIAAKEMRNGERLVSSHCVELVLVIAPAKSSSHGETKMKIAALEADHKIQLPAEWVDELGLQGFAELEKGPDGIVVRRCSHVTWDDVFADKLTIGSHTSTPDLGEVSGDDYLF